MRVGCELVSAAIGFGNRKEGFACLFSIETKWKEILIHTFIFITKSQRKTNFHTTVS
jgi:hypothetical protein